MFKVIVYLARWIGSSKVQESDNPRRVTYGPFTSQQAAERCAINAANNTDCRGCDIVDEARERSHP